jgi:hypothetical protein
MRRHTHQWQSARERLSTSALITTELTRRSTNASRFATVQLNSLIATVFWLDASV